MIFRERSGDYACKATNRIGGGESQNLFLDVKCKYDFFIRKLKMRKNMIPQFFSLFVFGVLKRKERI